ncbi:MAG: hypothetical protein ACR2GD_05355, partial [Pyrinomonadaceae bacterium]
VEQAVSLFRPSNEQAGQLFYVIPDLTWYNEQIRKIFLPPRHTALTDCHRVVLPLWAKVFGRIPC